MKRAQLIKELAEFMMIAKKVGNNNAHQGIQVPQEPVGTELSGFAYIYDTTQQILLANDQVTFNTNSVITPGVCFWNI